MKQLAFLSTLFTPTSLDSKGGVEVWTANFVKELTNDDYVVDLFAAKKSIDIPGRVNLKALGREMNQSVDQSQELQDSIKRLGLNPKEYKLDLEFALYLKTFFNLINQPDEYDLVIDNAGIGYMSPNWDLYKKPVVLVCHYTPDLPHISLFKLLPIPKNIIFVFLTRLQMDQATWIPDNQKVLIYHGLDISQFTFTSTAESNLLWIGRISPIKGLEDAIQVSRDLSIQLDIYGYKDNLSYFDQSISPLLNSQANLIENNYDLKLHSQHKVLLFPIKWEEAFGLVMLEALACGTPVIAYARGSVPEVIEDGKTGFLVNPSDEDIRGDWIIKQSGIEGLKAAVKKIYEMDEEQYQRMRKNCRESVERKFSLTKMVDEYKKLFERLISDSDSHN